jgi:hypothetical protein
VLQEPVEPVDAKNPGGLLARSCTTADYTAEAVVDVGSLAAGALASLSAFGEPGNAVGAGVSNGQVILWRVEKGRRHELAKKEVPKTGQLHLRLSVKEGHLFRFSFSTEGKEWTPLGDSADGDYLPPWDRSIRVALVANGGEARFASFRIEPVSGQR